MINMVDDDTFLMHIGGLPVNSSTHILNQNNDRHDNGELEVITHSPYYFNDDITCRANDKSNLLTFLSLNCASINAKFDQLIIKL